MEKSKETKETKETKDDVLATQPQGRGVIVYEVAGQEVKLSFEIVKNYLTKGNGQVTDPDIVQFMSICKYNQLNPFLNEAYLIKFGTQPASMIVSKEAFFKRAEAHDKYEGIQAGIIVLRDNTPIDLEGCFFLATDKLIGGWAKVFRSDRKYPIVARVSLSEYDKGQSIWKDKPSTMISKVAKVQALREAFPAQLGAMYTAEEQNVIDITHEDVSDKVTKEKAEKANKTVINIDGDLPNSDKQESSESKETVNTEKSQKEMEGNLFKEKGKEKPGF